jgi:uncharacterized repeat protein (TIGR03803 family)
MPKHPAVAGRSKLGIILAIAFLPSTSLAGGSEKVLYRFQGGTDGSGPTAGLTIDSSGKMYGTTREGGDTKCPDGLGQGCGVIFQTDKQGKEKVLHAFAGGNNDGEFPDGGLLADGAGNYYGVTASGGPKDTGGTVFKLAPDRTESIVYAFQGGADGRGPVGNLVVDGSGNLYGTTIYGGDLSVCDNGGCGTVFEVAPDGTHTVLHAFEGGKDGEAPFGGLIADSIGNLYGTTALGGDGCNSPGCGTVFKIAPGGAETILHTFQANGSDGLGPGSGLIMDRDGNLYGTTSAGGSGGTPCQRDVGCGTVFQVFPDGTETVLYSFQGLDGSDPGAGVVMDSPGNLYGTTSYGGGAGCPQNQGCGSVFELAPDGKESVLFAFKKGGDGDRPIAPLLLVGKKLYGTTLQGGRYNNGVVFSVRK